MLLKSRLLPLILIALVSASTTAQEARPTAEVLKDNPFDTQNASPFDSTVDETLSDVAEPFLDKDDYSKANEPKTDVPPGSVSASKLVSPEESEARIRKLLSSEAELSFYETPLLEAADYISDVFEFPVLIDHRALEEIGIDDEALVDLDVENISLRSALKLMLRDLDLTYVIKNEVMLLTTNEASDHHQIVMTYPLPSEIKDDAGVVNAITYLVRPASWSSAGGPSSLIVIENVIFVSAIEEVQEEVADVLRKLTKVISAQRGKNNVTSE